MQKHLQIYPYCRNIRARTFTA